MKKITSILILFLTVFFVWVVPVQAHVLVTDKSIGAIMHIDPDDDPIVGQQSSFFFEFKDKQNKFSPVNCSCTFLVKEDGKTIFTQPLFQNTAHPSLTNASVFYTFPKRAVYEILVVGKPNIVGAFQSFTLTYDVRVDQIASGAAPANQSALHVWITTHVSQLIGGIVVLAIIVWVLVRKRIKT